MARIAVGGFQHETNTFSPHPATLLDFETPDAWPGLVRGPAMLEAVEGINLPAAGFVAEARELRHELLPLTWCAAQPSGRVTRAAYEHISALLLDDLQRAGNLDAVYLDLHGAMVAEHIDDGDGDLLRRVRLAVGPDIPIVASLDYHANVSPLMVREASVLVTYRTVLITAVAWVLARYASVPRAGSGFDQSASSAVMMPSRPNGVLNHGTPAYTYGPVGMSLVIIWMSAADRLHQSLNCSWQCRACTTRAAARSAARGRFVRLVVRASRDRGPPGPRTGSSRSGCVPGGRQFEVERA